MKALIQKSIDINKINRITLSVKEQTILIVNYIVEKVIKNIFNIAIELSCQTGKSNISEDILKTSIQIIINRNSSEFINQLQINLIDKESNYTEVGRNRRLEKKKEELAKDSDGNESESEDENEEESSEKAELKNSFKTLETSKFHNP